MTTEAPPPQAQSPLSAAELAELEATLLPTLERHHLRLLAHSLRSLQAVATHQPAGALPGHDAICAWASQQPALADAPCFQAVLVEQLEAAGRQLQQLATTLDRAPLALELGDLIAAACDHRHSHSHIHSPGTPVSEIQSESIADALSFFRLSCGRWRSQRSSHHLLHRRAEAGGSFIEVVEIAAADPRLIAIAELHGEDPAGLVGGCRVTWNASMAWDKAGEAHEGESVFGLIPTDEIGRSGLYCLRVTPRSNTSKQGSRRAARAGRKPQGRDQGQDKGSSKASTAQAAKRAREPRLGPKAAEKRPSPEGWGGHQALACNRLL